MLSANFAIKTLTAALIAFIVLYSIYIIQGMKNKRKAVFYIDNFKLCYEQTKSIKSTLLKLRTLYNEKSNDYLVISKAVYYLEHSILKDYRTALNFIEKIYDTKEIKELHQECINQSAKEMLLMLEMKEYKNKEDEK